MDGVFTDRARKVMRLATEEAKRFNHEYVGTEHMLLALMKEGCGVGAHVLESLGVDLLTIRLEVKKLVQSGPDVVTLYKLPWTPRAKQVIENSIKEAGDLGHNYVGSEHIFLGLLREQKGVAAQVLMNLGVRLEQVRAETQAILGLPHDEAGSADADRERRIDRQRDDEAELHDYQEPIGRVDFASWVLRVLGWDGLLPAFVLLVPVLINVLSPNNHDLADFVGLTLPIAAFIIRFFVGEHHIWSNGCSKGFRVVQTCLLCFGIFWLFVVDTILVLAHEIHGFFANWSNCRDMAVAVLVYLPCVTVAMYPGRRKPNPVSE